ncbi:MAG: uracil-DNA glycosylase [Armatimonadota bacterium]|nr:uracil-DNA glycosylase [Armatimonadota bacterium]MDR7607167.1 uracil-DNA glycosylase [Armatimonadota bacterium]
MERTIPAPVERALAALEAEVVACRRCPRLVAYREQVAREKKREYRDWAYWGRPVPGFGDPQARVLVVGLAPAAHGANRTGRMFTGDLPNGASVWLVRTLYRTGFANQPTSLHQDDGLRLHDAYVTAAVRCAPPQNRPTPAELENCLPFLVRELVTLPRVRVVVALGAVAFQAVLKTFAHLGVQLPRPRPPFVHGTVYRFAGTVAGRPVPAVLCTYHPSRQNTQTGKLTARMLEAVFRKARRLAEEDR